MKVPDGSIDRRARESRGTRDEGDPPSPQPFGIEGDDEVSLPLIEVGEQRGVFLLQFFFSAHTGRIPNEWPHCNGYYFTFPYGDGETWLDNPEWLEEARTKHD